MRPLRFPPWKLCGVSLAQWVRSIFDVSGMVYTAVAESGGTILRGTSKWKEVKALSGHLEAEVNEAQGKRWKTREKFHSGLEDEACYSERLTRSRCGTGSVSTTMSSWSSSSPRTSSQSAALPKALFRTPAAERWSHSARRNVALPAAGAAVSALGVEALRALVLKASFSAADKDRDGRICPADFALMLRRAFPEMSRQEIDQEWAMADCNCNGFFEMKEFGEWLRPEADAVSHQPLQAVFRLWDLAVSGSISGAELQFVLTQVGANLKQEEVDELFSMMHPAQDGEISFDEFVSFLFPAERRIRGPSRSSSLELLP